MERGRAESRERRGWSRKVLELQCGGEVILVDLNFLPAGFGPPAQFRLAEKIGNKPERQYLLDPDLTWKLYDEEGLRRWLHEKYGDHTIISEMTE